MATIKLTPDFKEFLQLLNSQKIEYMLIGGYAVALYGFVRPTKDLDVWIAASPASQGKLADVLVKFGFSPEAVRQPLFTEQKRILRMGVPPNRLEILVQIAGVEFSDCHSRCRTMEIDGVPVPVISYADLIANKRAANRASDRVDVERLEARRSQP